ncbi:RDD family protein [Streptomyces roseoverticillatus]|uniref:RDD family protein n=1 Tax=Streptomyces roseoverticillatus TaxID=66429 RepID=UPI001F1DE88F|nr:RDD family protein [Streptomyces roseoverticillatus]MCF3104608.1 RDD family protein [Streptomyces roseoverticillatus]
MSTEPPPEDDPFKKRPTEPPLPPYGSPPPGAPPPPGPGSEVPYGGDPYGGPPPGPGGGPGNPYGDEFGAADPLAGMPPLANRFKRLVARIIDALLVSIPVTVVFKAAMWDWDPANWNDGRSTSLGIIIAVVYFLYEGLMLTKRGQTVGKMAMSVRVAMLENGAIPQGSPGWTRAAVYNLPQVVPCCGFLFWLVNVLWCTWDMPYHQCIHDKAAKTVVVSTVQ